MLSHLSGAKWKIHMGEEEFLEWKKGERKCLLFFDGASKGNPGVTGVEGIIVYLEGMRKIPLDGH